MEFKSCEAAEKCVMENNGVAVIDGFLYLTYAIPGYSGDDFVLKRPEHMKRSQVAVVTSTTFSTNNKFN